MIRVAFIGCVDFSRGLLERVLAHEKAEVVGVVSRAASKFNADFCSLEPLARQHGLPYLPLQGNDQAQLAAWLREHSPDVVYCLGWSYLLGPEVLAVAPLGVVGYHPAALPQNRGRHPIIWALALGLDSTASTFFFMDEGADSGDILSQVPVEIRPDDDARTLYDRLQEVAAGQVDAFTGDLATGRYSRVPQDHGRANYWRKRTKADGLVDWRMSSRSVHNLVRALARPYPGAHLRYEDQETTVWRVRREDDRFSHLVNVEPGKVIEADASSFVVKCGEGAVRVVECAPPLFPPVGTYLQ